MRFLTALVLMALLLGTGGPRMGSVTPSGATEFRSVASAARSSAVETPPPSATDPAARVGQTGADDDLLDVANDLPDAAEERPAGADEGLRAVPARLAALVGPPAGTVARPEAGPGVRTAADGYVGAIGPRAPPLG